MTSVAPTSTTDQIPVPTIVQQVSSVQSAVQGLGPDIQTDAEQGDFGGILSPIQGAVQGQSPTSANTSASPVPRASTLGSSLTASANGSSGTTSG